MTRSGRVAIGLGLLTYLVAWALGSKALYPVATGLVLAAILGWCWVHVAHRPVHLTRETGRKEHYEGDDVDVAIDVSLSPGLVPPPAPFLRERLSKLGERETRLRRSGDRLEASYAEQRLPRGRYVLEQARVVYEDPFGFARQEKELQAAAALVVYPRLVSLERLFSDAGAALAEGRRLVLRRPTGFDLHSVREHQQGDSLRRVHWRSTAKLGRLMVKELEDAPRDEVAVLLDARRGGAFGEAFDTQVRAAGSIMLAHTSRGRRSALILNGAFPEVARATGSDDWKHVLELLAAAEPDGERPVELLLADESGAASRALELAVVTSLLTPALVERLVQRALAHRHVSVAYIDAATFTGLGRTPEAGLLRLQAAGVPVAVVRAGADLAQALGATRRQRAAHG